MNESKSWWNRFAGIRNNRRVAEIAGGVVYGVLLADGWWWSLPLVALVVVGVKALLNKAGC
jgi:hypothetical protein